MPRSLPACRRIRSIWSVSPATCACCQRSSCEPSRTASSTFIRRFCPPFPASTRKVRLSPMGSRSPDAPCTSLTSSWTTASSCCRRQFQSCRKTTSLLWPHAFSPRSTSPTPRRLPVCFPASTASPGGAIFRSDRNGVSFTQGKFGRHLFLPPEERHGNGIAGLVVIHDLGNILRTSHLVVVNSDDQVAEIGRASC